jgi:hypothetical protein
MVTYTQYSTLYQISIVYELMFESQDMNSENPVVQPSKCVNAITSTSNLLDNKEDIPTYISAYTPHGRAQPTKPSSIPFKALPTYMKSNFF